MRVSSALKFRENSKKNKPRQRISTTERKALSVDDEVVVLVNCQKEAKGKADGYWRARQSLTGVEKAAAERVWAHSTVRCSPY
jgi:hypothetical protein